VTISSKKKNINLGMAASLPNGNLIVPVIKNADQLNLVGMAKAVADSDDTQGGTYTVTNDVDVCSFSQVGILAWGH
jgi:2-oxoglutarate dehydrogenase E2 component (dihydrolipoamide succinyltransferase)